MTDNPDDPQRPPGQGVTPAGQPFPPGAQQVPPGGRPFPPGPQGYAGAGAAPPRPGPVGHGGTRVDVEERPAWSATPARPRSSTPAASAREPTHRDVGPALTPDDSGDDPQPSSRERKAVLLRLDPGVHGALARWAADDLRSVNAQLEWLLRRALDDASRLPRRTPPQRGPGRPAGPPSGGVGR